MNLSGLVAVVGRASKGLVVQCNAAFLGGGVFELEVVDPIGVALGSYPLALSAVV